jgi:hypothetical protein
VKQSNVEKEKVAKEIADKLGRTKGVSYAAIAMKASECGRPEIAIKVLLRHLKLHLSIRFLILCKVVIILGFALIVS